MLIESRELIDVPRAQLWDFLMDIEQVGECVPGVSNVRLVAPEEYEATMKLKVGPVSLKLDSRLRVVERDREHWTAKLEATAAEHGVGGKVRALFTMTLAEAAPGSTELLVTTDARIVGKLGEFGQPVMRKKADAITAGFAQTIAERVASEQPQPPLVGAAGD